VRFSQARPRETNLAFIIDGLMHGFASMTTSLRHE